jgi:NTP pyrophosphatase (non-canonical NTP hydrolase)
MTKEIEAIIQERKRQDEKWGVQNHGPSGWLAILVEEVGETAKAILEGSVPIYRRELTQVAAVAVAALECADRQAFEIPSLVEAQQELSRTRKKAAGADKLLDALCRIRDGQWPQAIPETEGTVVMREVARAAVATFLYENKEKP